MEFLMIIIVDGYNVLKTIHATPNIVTETQRTAFINSVSRYGTQKNHTFYIVFDAGPSRSPITEKKRGTTIIYTGTHQSADDYIIHLAKKYKTRECMVITADRDLKNKVEHFNAHVILPHLFYTCITLKKAQEQQTATALKENQLLKTTTDLTPDLDAYFHTLHTQGKMHQLPQKIDDLSENATLPSRRSKSRDLSKKEKLYLKKVGKL